MTSEDTLRAELSSDDPVVLVETLLRSLRRRLHQLQESPLDLLRRGQLDQALDHVDALAHEVVTWYLLLAAELHATERPEAARSVLSRLLDKADRYRGQGRFVHRFLAYLIALDPDRVAELGMQLDLEHSISLVLLVKDLYSDQRWDEAVGLVQRMTGQTREVLARAVLRLCCTSHDKARALQVAFTDQLATAIAMDDWSTVESILQPPASLTPEGRVRQSLGFKPNPVTNVIAALVASERWDEALTLADQHDRPRALLALARDLNLAYSPVRTLIARGLTPRPTIPADVQASDRPSPSPSQLPPKHPLLIAKALVEQVRRGRIQEALAELETSGWMARQVAAAQVGHELVLLGQRDEALKVMARYSAQSRLLLPAGRAFLQAGDLAGFKALLPVTTAEPRLMLAWIRLLAEAYPASADAIEAQVRAVSAT